MPVPTATILSDGQEMDPSYQLVSLDITKEVNRIPDARLILLDGGPAEKTFTISDTAFFEPGKEIEIKLAYLGDEEVTVFKGLVVRHGVEASTDGSRLTVELKDAAITLTHIRKSAVHREQTDDAIISQLIGDAGLTAGTVESTQPTHVELVQYYATDWDFIVSRADVCGLVIVVDDGEISAPKMEITGSASHTFQLGIDEIFRVELDISGAEQQSGVQSVAWDIANQAMTSPSEAADVTASQGNLEGGGIADTIGFEPYVLSSPVPNDPDALQAWADARMARSRLSLIRGRITIPGASDIKPMGVIALEGIGERFNGDALVTGVTQRLDKEGWRTELQLGLSPEWFANQPNIADAPAAGLLPPVRGLQIGVVDAFEADPDGEYRVKVLLPAVDEADGIVWARMSYPEAGADRGYVFWPETGDEVVIGFFDNNPGQAVILGSLYSSANAPPAAIGDPAEDNIAKGFVTKAGTAIAFDDDKVSVTIETPGANKIVIDDDAQSVLITDQHGNSITMDSNGITMESAKDFIVKASGNVQIEGSAVDVK